MIYGIGVRSAPGPVAPGGVITFINSTTDSVDVTFDNPADVVVLATPWSEYRDILRDSWQGKTLIEGCELVPLDPGVTSDVVPAVLLRT